jgi:hypothetical protein
VERFELILPLWFRLLHPFHSSVTARKRTGPSAEAWRRRQSYHILFSALMSDYDSIGKGDRGDLYATLMSETFARDVNAEDVMLRKEDVMLQQTLRRVDADEAMRARLQGPTIKKEKFSSRYWSTWNKEKNLLEDLSYADMLNPPKKNSAVKEYKKNKRRAVHVQLTNVAPKGQKVLIFDIPLPPTRIKKQPFDAHLPQGRPHCPQGEQLRSRGAGRRAR